MKISTKGRYGLRALVELARNKGAGAIPLRKIAEKQDISEQYLEQLFSNLRKANLVESVRGAKGGYLLSDDPANINVREIIVALEGPIAPVQCVVEGAEECGYVEDCVTKVLWEKLKICIDDMLKSITLKDLLDESLEE